tara:strand:- start:488 stop:1012 length:525 start_codon:yes stop_codon:yes gene_type:complete
MLIPLFILSLGAIFSGIAFKDLLIGTESSVQFWKSSIYFIEPLSSDHPPLWFLLLTPTLVTLSIPISFYMFVKNKQVPEYLASSNEPLYTFLKNKWYFDELYDFLLVRPSKKIGHYFWKKVDGSIIDKFGPDGISNIIKKISFKAVKFQSGFIYQYAFIMLLGFSIILTILIIN